jgi:arylsulfatase A-like enzyme
MPRTFRTLVRPGVEFTDAVDAEPLCCPSRATMLTGQYGHNTNVLSNRPGYSDLVDKHSVLPVWLRHAGYRTIHVGKWLHGYDDVAGSAVAPGWDRWVAQMDPRAYYRYKLSVQGRVRHFGTDPADNVTKVINDYGAKYLRQELRRKAPVYMQLDEYSPHGGGPKKVGNNDRCTAAARPENRDRDLFKGVGAPRTAAFNEDDMSDKPFFAQHQKLDDHEQRRLDRRYRCTLQSLRGLDRGVNKMVSVAKRAGELGNTVFIFLTDNGYLFGEHRVKDGKARFYEPSIRTPLIMRLPPRYGDTADVESDATVASVDLAPTILDLARADPCIRHDSHCRRMDGRSMLPVVFGDDSDFRNRGIIIEMDERDPGDPRATSCAFSAIRTGDAVYAEHTSVPDPHDGICQPGLVKEMYDLDADPQQLDNVSQSNDPRITALRTELAARLARLQKCSGVAGRDAPRSKPFCE